ncbi:DUF4280 domain-containing protein [Streptomyces sp. TRM 70351]|uniref:DUF4280 domain-containing protein n=1 Tax=Streptomyces sp. TRM 70351 TaxID=3116552 RepID=UPI002E7BA0B8|nr:DUF4280 domain-containing protein [Streptomyces sp. TRM 70351]MEE1927558.1 DUF4280 domain-containing protein [Streptomyces sp. TRM 70351]
MGTLVVAGAVLRCSLGLTPAALVVPPRNVTASGRPVATVQDMRPVVNLASFGLCTSPANPAVATATAAAAGVPTPAPCVPAVTTPWTPGSPSVRVGRVPALTAASTCLCRWAGVVGVVDAGQRTTRVAG